MDKAHKALKFLSDRYYHVVENDGEDNGDRFAAIDKALEHEACPYCAGDMCARFDGLGCTHDTAERHGYGYGAPDASRLAIALAISGAFVQFVDPSDELAIVTATDRRAAERIATAWPLPATVEDVRRADALYDEETHPAAPWNETSD